MPPAIEFRDVTLETGGRPILDHVSLAIERGSTTAILGRSGSGKTTLLRMVNRLASPTAGTVLVDGHDIASTDLIGLRRGIGYVIQETGLFPHLTVARNATMIAELERRPRAGFPARVRELLTLVGLDPDQFAARYPWQLSGGQRQRVGIARALCVDPPILLMDEPFGALDPLTRAEMQEMLVALLARLRSEGKREPAASLGKGAESAGKAAESSGKPAKNPGKTVLLVTHDLDEALFLASRIVLVEAGSIVADLPPHEFLHSPEPAVRAYVQAFHRGEREQA